MRLINMLRRSMGKKYFIPKGSMRQLGMISVALAGSAVARPSFNQALSVPSVKAVSIPVQVVNKTVQRSSNIVLEAIQTVNDAVSWLLSCIHTLLRCGTLCLTFAPAATTLPVALVASNEAFWDWWWCLFRSSICTAGPTFIKFAQWAAMRPDLFDSRICRELSKLQSGARVHSWEQTRGILQSILGEHWEETLQLKSDDLVGSGCVAQVYRGKVLVRSQGSGTGKDASTSGMEREVAVKVLHPRVRESMHLDLNLMRSIAHAAEWAGETLLRLLYGNQDGTVALAAVESYPLRCVSLLESVDEFSDFMLSQLDLRHEAAALERLRRNFAGAKWRDRIVVPEPVYISSDPASQQNGDEGVGGLPHQDVLVETFEAGESMIDIMSASKDASQVGEDDSRGAHLKHMYNKEIAALGLDAILKMLFEDNFIHADLHAGNLLVRPAPAASRTARSSYAHPQLVLLDAGLTIELKPFDRRNFISLFRAVIDNDGREVARLMMEYSPRSTSTSASGVGTTGDGSQLVPLSDVYATVIRPEEYMQEMGKLVSYVHAHGLSLNKISVSELLQNVLRLSYEHNVKLESRFVSVIVAIMLAEGMGRRLDPEVDIIARATPFIRAATINMLIK